MSTKIKPLGDRILVKACEEKVEMIGGIVLPGSAQEKPQESIVVALGTGKVDEKGNKISFDVKVGDKVLTEQYGGTRVKQSNGEEFVIYESSQIIAVIEE
ncbi:MAG: co-chaperone GroES [Lentisphaeria bacterium]